MNSGATIVLLRALVSIGFVLFVTGCHNMSEELEARIKKVDDVQEITNLQAQYSYLIDTKQMEALVDIFADDFVWEGGFDSENMTTVTSKPELLRRLKSSGERNTMMRHLVTTPYIEVKGDHAKGTWYVLGMTTAVTPEGEIAEWVQGTLNNEYTRINGKWKISRKSTTFNFYTPYEDGWHKTRNSRGLPEGK